MLPTYSTKINLLPNMVQTWQGQTVAGLNCCNMLCRKIWEKSNYVGLDKHGKMETVQNGPCIWMQQCEQVGAGSSGQEYTLRFCYCDMNLQALYPLKKYIVSIFLNFLGNSITTGDNFQINE